VGVAAPGRRRIWVIARQHPGEAMGEWFVEGMIHRLLGSDDPTVRALLEGAVITLVPNANPDGTFLGNLRTNAAGADLNRSWRSPSRSKSPEVWALRQQMLQRGVDLLLDVHGDERCPYPFLCGCEGNPGYSERQRFLENRFEQALCEADDDFRDDLGHPYDEPGTGDLQVAANWAGETFRCLAYTLEMPFCQDPALGDWSIERSLRAGHAALDAIAACLPHLRSRRRRRP